MASRPPGLGEGCGDGAFEEACFLADRRPAGSAADTETGILGAGEDAELEGSEGTAVVAVPFAARSWRRREKALIAVPGQWLFGRDTGSRWHIRATSSSDSNFRRFGVLIGEGCEMLL